MFVSPLTGYYLVFFFHPSPFLFHPRPKPSAHETRNPGACTENLRFISHRLSLHQQQRGQTNDQPSNQQTSNQAT